MKYYELDKEEQEILNAYEKGELKARKPTKKELIKLKRAAQATLYKTRNINIRLTERDLYKLKALAIEEGLPYQTLAGSIIRKYTNAASK